MAARLLTFLCAITCLLILDRAAAAAEPRVINGRYKLEQIAKEPQIVTPIGMAFDRSGRLLVIESHTHQRPKDYQGPAGDRIRMLSDSDGDGRLDHWSTFAEGFRHAMNLFVRPDGAVYLVTRHNVVLLRDTDHDGVADKQDELLRLETQDDYPHNGLSGIALEQPENRLLISMGENHGTPYRLVGSDGKSLSGKDGSGTVFQCTPEGGDLRRLAIGFWNPFSLCVVPDGRIFAVDNDPDACPCCRLVHVIPGGDYGFRYQYGRAGTHPLQAWDGELPGTLPMVCGVGEAPTAILPYAGGLWVASWGDHRIERYQLVPRGASYSARREVIVQGDTDYRPTGMAIAPDGSIYFGDWVLRDYPVHGHGRIWRLTLPAAGIKTAFPPRSTEDLAATGKSSNPVDHAESDDAFTHARGVWQLSQAAEPKSKLHPDQRLRFSLLQAARLRGTDRPESILLPALHDESTDIRLFAVRWIADERIATLRDEVAKLLDGPQPTPRYYLAVLGALDWLDHKPGMRGAGFGDELLVRELQNDRRSPEAHALALALVKPDNKFLTIDRLRVYLAAENQQLRLEAIRTLAQQTGPKRGDLLAQVATDERQSDGIRAEAIVGLGSFADQNAASTALANLLKSKSDVLRHEVERTLRLASGKPPDEAKPTASDIAGWAKSLAKPGDAAAGRRLFFSPVGARCSVCHQYGGRGGNIGPDLTMIGRSTSREKILTSILQPSQEIAPDYQPWVLITTDGKTYTGLRLPKPGDDGQENYVDAAGKEFILPSSEIEERRASSTSIMPDNLQSILSVDDLRDLLTFLAAGKVVP